MLKSISYFNVFRLAALVMLDPVDPGESLESEASLDPLELMDALVLLDQVESVDHPGHLVFPDNLVSSRNWLLFSLKIPASLFADFTDVL